MRRRKSRKVVELFITSSRIFLQSEFLSSSVVRMFCCCQN
jgi:hypothetical protein